MRTVFNDPITPITCRTSYTEGGRSFHTPDLPLHLSLCESLTLSFFVPRLLGIERMWLTFHCDDGKTTDLLLPFTDTQAGVDTYALSCSTNLLCQTSGAQKDAFGAFCHYEVQCEIFGQRFFLEQRADHSFLPSQTAPPWLRLLFSHKDFSTPDWAKRGVMYHIFVDRFLKGAGDCSFSPDSEVCEDWENGQVQYPPYPGAPFKNNLFFGGNLYGIIEKLDYLCALGVTTLYLSPIFRARSNHKYDTGDYMEVDPSFGGDTALDALIQAVHQKGMYLILDGVFNHTGDDSRFFNRYGTYDSLGAYQSPDSPYADWYSFQSFPDHYDCWWGIPILPRLHTDHPACANYFLGKEGVLAHYLARGIDGWRLDVADELCEDFLFGLRRTVKGANPQALILGEVWENAADKIAYGKRRHYLQGGQLDSVMNYPFRNAVLAYLRTQNAVAFAQTLSDLYRSYPRCVCDVLMNLLGTHDTERIATVLGGESAQGLQNCDLVAKRMAPSVRARACTLLRLASVLQYTVYGFPSVFYGDEIAMEGYQDPFCRRPYPWHAQDEAMLAHYQRLGKLRAECEALCGGDFTVLQARQGLFSFLRQKGKEKLYVVVNCGAPAIPLLPRGNYYDCYHQTPVPKETLQAPLAPYDFWILRPI